MDAEAPTSRPPAFRSQARTLAPALVLAAVTACAQAEPAAEGAGGAESIQGPPTAFVGATIWDGTGASAIPNAVMVVRAGRVQSVGPANEVAVPAGATEVRLDGRFVTPGLVNAHGHVGGINDPLTDLGRYARFGITTVNSLGGEPDAAEPLRDVHTAEQIGEAPRARLLMASTVVTGDTPEEALEVVRANVELGVDYIKIRVDDNLGATEKMAPEVYRAVIDAAHENGLPLAAHLFYLDDAKDLIRSGADLVAHSVRDRAVDEALIDLLVQNEVCYVPTLMREASTFVYRERPGFMDDPLLTADVDSAQVARVESAEFQQGQATSRTAPLYERAMGVAIANVKALSDGGVTIAMGTDTGPLGRFQGYFEHHELGVMVEGGLTPAQALLSATRDAARCIGRPDLGTLVPGNWADFVVFESDPLADIGNTRTRERVYVGGRRVPLPGPAEP